MSKEAFDYILIVAGKKVVLKHRLPVSEGHLLPQLLKETVGGDLRTNIPVCQMLIESWEFPGSPQDPASYEALDTLSEMLPLAKLLGEHVVARAGLTTDNVKN